MSPNLVGKAIRKLRIAKGMEIQQLASIAGVPKSNLSAWERGVNKLDPQNTRHREVVGRIAKALDCMDPELLWQGRLSAMDHDPFFASTDVRKLEHKDRLSTLIFQRNWRLEQDARQCYKHLRELIEEGDHLPFRIKLLFADHIALTVESLLEVSREELRILIESDPVKSESEHLITAVHDTWTGPGWEELRKAILSQRETQEE